MKKNYYITTAIDYVNGKPHIGHALEKIQADVLARFHRLSGEEVFFLGGTDENAQKNVLAAEKRDVPVEDFIQKNAESFKEMADLLNISFNDFIRTSDKEKHWPGVRKLWEKCFKNGDIYKKKYTGLYCVGCEAFVTKKDLVDGKCPEHLKEPEKVSEENYFFRLSKYQDKLKRLIKNDGLKIVPEKRKKETLSFIESGLEDFSVSRPTERMKGWGVPVPEDEDQIVYCWMDALANYITALGYGREDDLLSKFWPADIHVIGKGILRFHAVYWPAFLLSAGVSLPRLIFVHDYITVEGQKMSKTIGNVVNPVELTRKYGSEAVRYFFLREVSPFQDGDFTYEKFEKRYNGDLADGLGNLASRVLTLAEKEFEGEVEARPSEVFEKKFESVSLEVGQSVKDYHFHRALAAVWDLVSFCDRYVDEKKPWETGDKRVLKNLLASLLEIGVLLKPFLPQTSSRILSRLGAEGEVKDWIVSPRKGDSLFPRIK